MAGMEVPLIDSAPPLKAWVVLTVLSGVAFTSNLNISLIAPILPEHFDFIRVPRVWCGVMFSCFPIGVLACSRLAMAAMSRFGRASVLNFGLVVQGVACISFGYSDAMTGGTGENPHAALAVCTICRLVCGGGAACANNAIFAIAADRFPRDLGLVMGLNEVLIGAGFTMGPPIGSALYLTGGNGGDFGLPFLVGGLSILILSPFALMLREPQFRRNDHESRGGLFDALSPSLLVAAVTLFFGTGVFGVVEPLLTPYLKNEVGVPVSLLGSFFAVFAGTYSLLGFVMGALADRVGALRVCTAGIFASGLIMASMFGPEAHGLAKGSGARLSYEMAALALLGVAQAAAIIPTLPAMKDGVIGGGAAATDAVVVWFNIFLQLGLAVTPLVSSVMIDSWGFEWTQACYGAVILSYGAFGVLYARRSAPHIDDMAAHFSSPICVSRAFSPTGYGVECERSFSFDHQHPGHPTKL